MTSLNHNLSDKNSMFKSQWKKLCQHNDELDHDLDDKNSMFKSWW